MSGSTQDRSFRRLPLANLLASSVQTKSSRTKASSIQFTSVRVLIYHHAASSLLYPPSEQSERGIYCDALNSVRLSVNTQYLDANTSKMV